MAADTVEAEVTVEPTRSGFSHRTVLDQAPEGDVQLRFPLKFSKGLKALREEATGDLRAVDADGETVFFAPAPTMWDAKINEASGLPAAETTVDTAIETVDGVQILVLTASKEWLQDTQRQYPVTIDPTWTSDASDTWVQEDVTGSKAGDVELRVGTFNGGVTKARSFLQFSSQALSGKKITNADLRLYNHYSYSCTSSPTEVQRLTSPWVSTDVRWTNQPTYTTSGEGVHNVSKGYSSACAAGYVTYPITPIAQYWADNPDKNYGVRLLAQDGTNNYTWKRYRSANYAEGTTEPTEPRFVVTYNSYPSTPSKVSLGAGQFKVSGTTTYATTLKPTLQATVSDLEKGNVFAEFDLITGSTTTLSKVDGSTVASGAVSKYTPGSNLVNGSTYTATAWGNDTSLRSKSAGASLTFTVDTTAPSTPSLSTPNYANNAWRQSAPSSNMFTFSTSSTDTEKFQYSKDGGSWTDLTATGTSSRTATLSWNPTGSHKLQVKAVDKAGHSSGIATFSFMNGLATLTAPAAGATTSDAFRVQANAPSSSTGTVTPTVYWRAAQDGGTDDTSTYGSSSAGQGWNAAQTLSPIAANAPVAVDTMLDVSTSPAGVLKALGKERITALVEIQVCFAYAGQTGSAAVQCSTNTTNPARAVTRLPHAFGDAYPVADAGDGQLALATGELNLSEADVSQEAVNTGLTISRTYSTYSGLGANSAIFGAGWRASLDGPTEGLAGMLVAESTAVDGTITLIDINETTLVFRQPGNTKTSLKTGTYTPANDFATASGLKLRLEGSGTAARIHVTEPDGTTTSFIKGALLEAGTTISEWTPHEVSSTGSTGTTKFTRDGQGKITRISAGTETDLSCDTTPNTKGCRVLDLTYEAGSNRLSTVTYTAWDPELASPTMATKELVFFTYKPHDDKTVLATAKDSRTGITTHYDYQGTSLAGVPLLASTEEKTASGERVSAPTYYGYGTGPGTGRPDWLETIHRGSPSTGDGKTQTARFVYGVNPAGDGATLPNLSETAVKM